jgi:hypothetical protein
LGDNPKTKNLLNAAMSEYVAFTQKDYAHYNGDLPAYFEIEGRKPGNLNIVKKRNDKNSNTENHMIRRNTD